MAAREGVRSSARLSGAATSAVPDVTLRKEARAAAAERAAAAALRRERAALAAERAREVEDSPRVLREKCRKLARALSEAKHLVVYTGAGISTAADIPDYRGPHGVWTRLQRGESIGRVDVSMAKPTFTHMALTALWARGALKFVVSQNCDGLHLRAGLPRRALAELHGDMFAERCNSCRRVYLRAFDTTERTARHAHRTCRLCHTCGQELRDTIVHFGERGRAAWPLNWAGALRHAAAADVVLCLGSSLKVLRRYPRLWRMHAAPHARPALYIVNLQWTPKDSVAALKINARCDTVMAAVARRLRLRVPRYTPAADPLLAHAVPLAPQEVHTTRRAPLPPPADDDTSYYELSSPSATDSDDELPLRRLADRLRPEHPLRSFQIDMKSGSATILLRAEHAPAEPPPPEPPPGASALRRFRIARPRLNGLTNGHDRSDVRLGKDHMPDNRDVRLGKDHMPDNRDVRFGNDHMPDNRDVWRGKGHIVPENRDVRRGMDHMPDSHLPINNESLLVKGDIRLSKDHLPVDEDLLPVKGEIMLKRNHIPVKEEACFDLEAKVKVKKKEESTTESDAEALAAAIIRRAVLVCRAQLYPGLHTILAPEPAACPWCARRYSARRCLWYGTRATPPERRARRRGRLCACCDDDSLVAAPAPGPGWYGKGYRKGRRRR